MKFSIQSVGHPALVHATAGKPKSLAFLAAASLATTMMLFSCDGRSPSGGGSTPGSGGSVFPSLVSVEYGRLTDIYAFRRIIETNPDRRDTRNRVPVLVQRDVVISGDIETQDLFDVDGNADPDANYRFLPFDSDLGHEELIILWDDRSEGGRYKAALDAATTDLNQVVSANRNQSPSAGPIPLVPRNAAIKLNFDRALPVDPSFFAANPAVLQLLEMRDDPDVAGPAAFVTAQFRVLTVGSSLILDTSLIGREAGSGFQSLALAPSPMGSTAANFRIAIPSEGSASENFVIEPDPNPLLNGLDARGGEAVIRDFRSGNISDLEDGTLKDREAPMVVADLTMTVLNVDRATGIIELDKGPLNLVPIRGRIPFVDGGTAVGSNLPAGPGGVPTVDASGDVLPLPFGDVLVQDVVSLSGEVFTMRAEIVENLEVGSTINGFKVLGRAVDGSDGGDLPTARVRVRAAPKIDSLGREVWFEAGSACTLRVHYYEHLNYASVLGSGAGEVSDSNRRSLFVSFDPPAPLLGPNGQVLPMDGRIRRVDPLAAVILDFSKPMDLDSIGPLDNFLLSQTEAHAGNIAKVMESPKSASLNVILSRLSDLTGRGTELRLSPPLGHFHKANSLDSYWLHLLLGDGAIVDLSGNAIETFDRRAKGTILVEGKAVDVPLQSFSVPFELEVGADENLVASRIHRFAAADEDGTKPGAADFFGQFELENGVLFAAEATRVSKTADKNNLGAINRYLTGQCVEHLVTFPPKHIRPFPLISTGGQISPAGQLYLDPSVVSAQLGTVPAGLPSGSNVFGGVQEPHTDRGSRLQMTYREDDFGLSYTKPEDLNLDVEQMHWAPWNDSPVLFDSFDRYSISLAHSRKRPDIEYEGFETILPPVEPGDPFLVGTTSCFPDGLTTNSGLSLTFADNVLDADGPMNVVRDQQYVISASDAFRSPSGVKYVPYPKFETTYTWRDSRHVSWDQDIDQPIGLGGSVNAAGLPSAGGDHTASIASPWESEDLREVLNPGTFFVFGTAGITPGLKIPVTTRGLGDFLGDRNGDHDPIALPLLMDISVFPDENLQTSSAINTMHIAHVGPPGTYPPSPGAPSPAGYYNAGFVNPVISGFMAPNYRVHSSGSIDPLSGLLRLVRPDVETVATGGTINDMGLGLFQAPPGDSNLPWAQIDLVRRVSMVTFGFFDSLRPNQHDLLGQNPALPGLPPAAGRPDMQPLGNLGLSEMMVIMDPPANDQPGGTKAFVELRGAETIPTPTLYNPASGSGAEDQMNLRGNLLNPNYAAEAYRYAGPDQGVEVFGAWDYSANAALFGRPTATGLTPYVNDFQLDSIRKADGFLPRYLNLRLILENNITSPDAARPSLRSLGVAYRIERPL